MNILFFPTPADFRAWLEQNHDKETELWVGFYKKGSEKPSITWPESVDQALCFGWIDGIRKSIDTESYKIRFTPRKPNSIWSAVNLKKMDELMAQGLVMPAGMAIYEKRNLKKQEIYSFEQENIELGETYQSQFKENAKAWKLFQAMPPSYRKTAIWWVISAKQESTRLKRLAILMECSEAGNKIPSQRREKDE
ncbi:MAG: YdeI/OmpD-associated family protein [Microscillaceae bacterium]|nr:YdeI/OmpD-associated family protein [Microscillaceae bacterium]